MCSGYWPVHNAALSGLMASGEIYLPKTLLGKGIFLSGSDQVGTLATQF
jgi:hypothetical protein